MESRKQLGDDEGEPRPIELLELDVDIRLSLLWSEALELGIENWDLDKVATFMRAAYGKGYIDALSELKRGELAIEHGYEVPERSPQIFPEQEQI